MATRTRFDKVHRVDAQHTTWSCCARMRRATKTSSSMVSAGFTGRLLLQSPASTSNCWSSTTRALICLSACLAGEIPQAILAGDYERAKQTGAVL